MYEANHSRRSGDSLSEWRGRRILRPHAVAHFLSASVSPSSGEAKVPGFVAALFAC